MKKKKMLIYDSTRGFAQFIKLHYSKEYEIDNLPFSKHKKFDFKNYQVAFFIINEPVEMLDLVSIYKKVSIFFIGTRLKNLKKGIQDFDSTIYLDFDQTKQEMLGLINFYLKKEMNDRNIK